MGWGSWPSPFSLAPGPQGPQCSTLPCPCLSSFTWFADVPDPDRFIFIRFFLEGTLTCQGGQAAKRTEAGRFLFLRCFLEGSLEGPSRRPGGL
eukprot:5475956-Pyramimonas_sp.AAC.1